MDYIAEAKRHIDFVLRINQWDYRTCVVWGNVFDGHLHRFSDIFANALFDPERDTITEYLCTSINALPHDYQRISANLLFFGDVTNG